MAGIPPNTGGSGKSKKKKNEEAGTIFILRGEAAGGFSFRVGEPNFLRRSRVLPCVSLVSILLRVAVYLLAHELI